MDSIVESFSHARNHHPPEDRRNQAHEGAFKNEQPNDTLARCTQCHAQRDFAAPAGKPNE